MDQKQSRSKEFIIGVIKVVELVTADESDSFNNDPIDEKEEAMSDTLDTITATINEAHAQSIEPNVVEPLSHLFHWRKICTHLDIPNCSFSGIVNLNYEDGHDPKSIKIFSDTIKLETLMNLVSEQSKLYMQQKGMVVNVEINELKAFIGTTLFMVYQTLPSICNYCSKDPGLGVKVVSDIMPQDCFFEIRTALHFVDNKKPHEKNDKVWKITSIINHFNQAFSHAMGPTSKQAIDEHMIKFKGQHSMKQYMPLKPIKRGFKMWCRNDSATGYRFQFDIYTGRKKNREGGLGENVVMQLSRSLIGTNVRLYFENVFTTPYLIFKLKEDQIYSCGTVR